MITNFIALSKKQAVLPELKKQSANRVYSIDILRGAVMIIMALDHTRDYLHAEAFTDSPTNLATTTPILFFTRFITHYCAPVFIFLSGISAYIAGERRTKSELSSFLIKRGIWLILVELFVINFSLSFDIHYTSSLLQVFWAIGWSMIILGILVRTSPVVILAAGALLVAGHNLLDYAPLPENGSSGIIWNILFRGKWSPFPVMFGRTAIVAYAILPWTGVMLLGYSLGKLYGTGFLSSKRRRILLLTGTSALVLFILLRVINQYGDPAPWSTQKNSMYTFLSFINVTKYPVSLQYILLTIGPALILLALLEKKMNRVGRFLVVYGRVPMFYYIIHFFLLHFICMGFFFAMGHNWTEAVDPSSPLVMMFRPLQFGVNLGIVYLVWISVVAILYLPCKWYGNYKKANSSWWLSYL